MGRFGTDGSFLVGTAANGGWTGNARLAAEKNGTGPAFSTYNAGDTCASFRVDNVAHYLVDYFYNTVQVGSISTNGTAVAYNTTSDARLKTVAADQRDYRQAIRALWVGDFTWNDSGAAGFGVLAQQAYEVMPNHQGVTKPIRGEGQWHASAEPFAHLALWGVKDLYAMVEALAARVAALETQGA